jgi:hypothetical protein
MSRKTRMQDIRKAKDRRAKKLAIGGAVLLAIVLAWEIPHFLGGKKSATPAGTTTVAASVDSTTPGTTTPVTTAGVTPTGATPATTPSPKLTSSDLPPRRSKGQLASFSTFASKDPFIQQVTADTGTGTTGTSSSTSTGTTSSTTTSGNKTVLTARTLARSGAVRISVNGRPQSVRVGASFPSSNPMFKLVSVTRGSVKIGIANGSYSSGAQTVSLRLNSPVTLVDSTNGVRYKLQLLA